MILMVEIIGTIETSNLLIRDWPLAILTIAGIFAVTALIAWAASLSGKDKLRNEQKRKEFYEKLGRINEELELIIALSKTLLPLKEDMDRLGADVVGRHAVVKIDDWPEQHAFGITHCCGFTLDWK